MVNVFHDPFTTGLSLGTVSLDELLGSADILSLHLPLNTHTAGMVNAEFLRNMKQHAIHRRPSCGARRMVESAAHLVDHVLPEWVLTFAHPLRLLFAAQPQVLSQVLGVVYRAISTGLIKKTGFSA